MGVVKNLLVRVGADVSGLVSGLSKAGGATGNLRKKAATDITSLKSKLTQMKSAYASITEAAKGVDLSKPVSKQITETKKELESLKKSAADLETQISFWSDVEPAGMQYKTEELKAQLVAVDTQTDNLYRKLQQLENIQSLGESLDIKDVTYSSLNKAQVSIASLEDELRRAESAAEETSDSTKDMGRSAQKAGDKVKAAAIKVGNIRKQSKSAAISVSDLAKSLRRMGIVAVGVKLAGAVHGEFRSIVTSYISQNDTLQAKVEELKNGFGQALAPAINVATNALTKLMPYVLGVSKAIGELATNLFGTGWTTIAEGAAAAADATNGAASAQNAYNRTLAGFDQITKLGSESSNASDASTTMPVDVTLPSWMTDLSTKLKQAVRTGDYRGVGVALAAALNRGIHKATSNDKSLGRTVSQIIQGGIDAADGFIDSLDWARIPELIISNVKSLISGISWKSIFNLAGSATGGIGAAVWGWISGEISSIWTNFKSELDAAGGNLFKALQNTVINAINWKNDWIRENIVMPFINGFADTFTASFSLQDLLDQGKSILKVGIELWKSGWVSLIDFVGEIVSVKLNLIKNGWTSLTTFVGDSLSILTSLKKDGWTSLPSFIGDAVSVWTSLKKKGWSSIGAFIGTSLAVAISLTKGWTGKLAKALGIESITSKLNLSLPEILIDWDTVTVFGRDFQYPTGFKVKWNAMGAILNGAQIFGRVGDTFLGGGEAGREALLPLDRNTGWMDKIADRVVSKISFGNGGARDLVIYLMLDGKVVTKTVVRNINAQTKATGVNPLAGYI